MLTIPTSPAHPTTDSCADLLEASRQKCIIEENSLNQLEFLMNGADGICSLSQGIGSKLVILSDDVNGGWGETTTLSAQMKYSKNSFRLSNGIRAINYSRFIIATNETKIALWVFLLNRAFPKSQAMRGRFQYFSTITMCACFPFNVTKPGNFQIFEVSWKLHAKMKEFKQFCVNWLRCEKLKLTRA